MVWQDVIISIANLMFVFSLTNQVTHGFKMKKSFVHSKTSIPTFVGLYTLCFVFFTLGLFLSAISSLITGTLWLTLFIHDLIYEKAH